MRSQPRHYHFLSSSVLLLLLLGLVAGLLPIIFSQALSSSSTNALPLAPDDNTIPSSTRKTIAVTGATGRTGSLVVQELMDRGYNVVAMVRDMNKAKTCLPPTTTSSSSLSSLSSSSSSSIGDNDQQLKIFKCDLGSQDQIVNMIRQNNCDAAIWCATGFSDNPTQSFLDKVAAIFGVALTPKKSIDAVGVVALAKAFQEEKKKEEEDRANLPKVIMLSSAGVTRPSWTEDKKKLLQGAADIPIVRLNPFNILNIKADSEERLRQSGVPYCIFRPTGLNDQWPIHSRPILSQGDVAVGRIHRKDVAKILVDCLILPEATGKTFEGFTVEGYPPATSISTALGRLRLDSDGPMSMEALYATYCNLQQLLPGEKQDAAALAMGQTYEQYDKGETGRLGQRGSENAQAAAPKPSS